MGAPLAPAPLELELAPVVLLAAAVDVAAADVLLEAECVRGGTHHLWQLYKLGWVPAVEPAFLLGMRVDC